MAFVVSFGGSELAGSALTGVGTFGEGLDERVLSVTVIPRNDASYART